MDQEPKLKTIKLKCEICGKTEKRIVQKEEDEFDVRHSLFYEYWNEQDNKVHSICRECEQKYHIVSNYSSRGYGYNGSCRPRMTKADKYSTPTYGLELEVAGNISNIDKIYKLAKDEMTIGYDTSVAGAQFEISYAPGTYYWYNYESKLQGVCGLLQKDKWVNKNSTSNGMHIHVGNIDKRKLMRALAIEIERNPVMWKIFKIFGERDFNQYCIPQILEGHHDAISISQKWGTIEFRMFKMTYDFEKIIRRIRFIRQITDNADEAGINWYAFKEDSKEYLLNLMRPIKGLSREIKKQITELFETERQVVELEPSQISRIERRYERIDEMIDNSRWYEDDEHDEEEEEEDY